MNPVRYNRFINNVDLSNTEPKIIFNYLKFGISFLNSNLTLILNQNGFISKFAGVFIHQKLKIERIDKGCALHRTRCELGDLLVIFFPQ